MKKVSFVLIGCLFVLCTCFFIYSCSKKQDVVINSSGTTLNSISDNLLQTAKDWRNKQVQLSVKVLNINTGKPAGTIAPNWQQAKLEKISDGTSLIVVPGPIPKLALNTNYGVVRKFVFVVDNNNKITNGKIIEMYSTKDYIANHSEFIGKL